MGYSNPWDAIGKFVDDRDKLTVELSALAIREVSSKARLSQNYVIINESGLYSLIMKSSLPTAKEFQHWVTSEVLPTLRKDGMYIVGEEKCTTDDELILRAFTLLQNKVERLTTENKILATDVENYKPKAMAYMDICNNGEYSIQTAADLLSNVKSIGRNELFEWLRQHNYVCKHSTLPYRQFIKSNLFKVATTNCNGKTIKQTYLTGKGLDIIYRKYIEENHITKAPPLF